ncbi:MAG: leucine--tRNA ligase [Bacteroidales bacterium]|nr:leucine--tRNA ligase [Bacteroidales bacterium]
MEYNFNEIEKKWQSYWADNKTYKVEIDYNKPKFYVLDMFPYPSGAGLHVGHPLGYIASDIYSRYKRSKGFNVLHPMGYDAYGLPAEQYAIQTGTHPAVTTEKNIARYRQQLDQIGFSFDWDREVRTSDPKYYKWTQWTFIQLFNSWFDNSANKAANISDLIRIFEQQGNNNLNAAHSCEIQFRAEQWNAFSYSEQQNILMAYRLAYLADISVNWCPALGTVLANDEVKEGLSERGGHPVEKRMMKQWSLRISAYAQRLLDGLNHLEWTESLKETQRNWIGRSEGASVNFKIKAHEEVLEVFTTRPDTLFGATFMVIAPEHEYLEMITTADQKAEVETYVNWAKNRSERERMSEVKTISGKFTGAYGINPLTGAEIPIWTADYVLSGYGTGAIMAVPGHDSRDFAFARFFNLPIIQVVTQEGELVKPTSEWEESYDSKEGIMINSGFLNGLEVKEAIQKTIAYIKEKGFGYGTINYRLRDAIFSRQRYWGEPFPVYFKDGNAEVLDEKELPLELPNVDKYLPTESGEPPLARAENWKTKEGYPIETSTMPGFAGSSAYYYRYMDPHNETEYFSKEANAYWENVDLYLGGDEHATGHLMYARFWSMFLFDLGLTVKEEPFKKLINQGKIQGRSSFVYRVNHEKYAEHMLWEFIKKEGLESDFTRDYRDGHRKFDFYFEKEKLIVEIKSEAKLEKLEEYYAAYIKDTDKKLLLIPIADILDNLEHVKEEIKQAVSNINKGLIFNHREIRQLKPLFISKNSPGQKLFSTALHVDIDLVHNDILDVEAFKAWREEYANADFILEDGKYVCGWEVEKMSKSKYNVQNPDQLIEKYGADTFRLYEMFLGPIENHKPWDTNGIEGVFRFMKKFWKLYHNNEVFELSNEAPSNEELKILHQTIKKVQEDIERFSFNTTVSQFMICTNQLTDLKCNKKAILEPLTILISSFAPHVAEELWQAMGHTKSINMAEFPEFVEDYIRENNFTYPVSFNGKMRFKLVLPIGMSKEEVEKAALQSPEAEKWLQGKAPKKVIVVPNKIVNVVI